MTRCYNCDDDLERCPMGCGEMRCPNDCDDDELVHEREHRDQDDADYWERRAALDEEFSR